MSHTKSHIKHDVSAMAYDAASHAIREVNLRLALRKALPHLLRLQEVEPTESLYRAIKLAQVVIEE